MADAAELVVRIRGDASDLEATISGVSQQLEELERTQSNTNGVKGVRESTSAYQGLASQLKDTGKGIKEVGESIDTITIRINGSCRRRCCKCEVCDRF